MTFHDSSSFAPPTRREKEGGYGGYLGLEREISGEEERLGLPNDA